MQRRACDRLFTTDLESPSFQSVGIAGAVWRANLLHDIGKLVLGFFFWEWAEPVQNLRKQKKCSFRQAEAELGDVADSLANDLGLGCMPGEEGRYDPRVLAKLGTSTGGTNTLATGVVSEIKTVVEQCS